MQVTLAIVPAALATLAIATPTRRGGSEPASSCTTGPVQCCQSVVPASSSEAQGILAGLVDVVIGDLSELVGLDCSSILSDNCSAQSVCCVDNSHSLISIDCVTVTL